MKAFLQPDGNNTGDSETYIVSLCAGMLDSATKEKWKCNGAHLITSFTAMRANNVYVIKVISPLCSEV